MNFFIAKLQNKIISINTLLCKKKPCYRYKTVHKNIYTPCKCNAKKFLFNEKIFLSFAKSFFCNDKSFLSNDNIFLCNANGWGCLQKIFLSFDTGSKSNAKKFLSNDIGRRTLQKIFLSFNTGSKPNAKKFLSNDIGRRTLQKIFLSFGTGSKPNAKSFLSNNKIFYALLTDWDAYKNTFYCSIRGSGKYSVGMETFLRGVLWIIPYTLYLKPKHNNLICATYNVFKRRRVYI